MRDSPSTRPTDLETALADLGLPHPREECIEAIEAVFAILRETDRVTRTDLENELDPVSNHSIGLTGVQCRRIGAHDHYLHWWWGQVILPALRAHPATTAHDDDELTWSLGPPTDDTARRQASDAEIRALARSLRRESNRQPESVDLDDLLQVLERHPMPPGVHRDGLAALDHLTESRAIDGRFVEPLVVLLTRPAMDSTPKLLNLLRHIAETDPDAVLDASDAIIECVSIEPTRETTAALKLCSTLVEHDSVRFVDLAPVAGAHLGGEDETCRRHAAYIMQKLAEHSPEVVAPHIDTIAAIITDASSNYQCNALIALGKCAAVVDEPRDLVNIARRLDDVSEDKVRANAVGVVADVTEIDPRVGVDHIDELVGYLDDFNANVRVNASTAILNAAIEDPKACQPALDPLLESLDDPDPAVRRNACRALGHLGSMAAYDRLQAKSVGDDDLGVRRLASWASSQVLQG